MHTVTKIVELWDSEELWKFFKQWVLHLQVAFGARNSRSPSCFPREDGLSARR